MNPSVHRQKSVQTIPYQNHRKHNHKNHNHDANSTAANTTTTDAGDKTEHIIMTAMKYLVHLQDSRQSTHPSPLPFPFPCEPPPTHQHTNTHDMSHRHRHKYSIINHIHPHLINQSENYAESRDRRTRISHPHNRRGLR
jgi:hypothetical protein